MFTFSALNRTPVHTKQTARMNHYDVDFGMCISCSFTRAPIAAHYLKDWCNETDQTQCWADQGSHACQLFGQGPGPSLHFLYGTIQTVHEAQYVSGN